MINFIIKRLLLSLLIVFLVSIFAFSLMHVLPGDPVRIALGNDVAQEVINKYRAILNLDKPLLTQYWLWITGVLHGNFGTSILYNEDVGLLMREKLPVTLAIGIPAMIFAIIFGVIFGILSAIKLGTWIDQTISFVANVGLGTPLFWIAILGIYLFGLELRVMPIQGYVGPSENFVQYLQLSIF